MLRVERDHPSRIPERRDPLDIPAITAPQYAQLGTSCSEHELRSSIFGRGVKRCGQQGRVLRAHGVERSKDFAFVRIDDRCDEQLRLRIEFERASRERSQRHDTSQWFARREREPLRRCDADANTRKRSGPDADRKHVDVRKREPHTLETLLDAR